MLRTQVKTTSTLFTAHGIKTSAKVKIPLTQPKYYQESNLKRIFAINDKGEKIRLSTDIQSLYRNEGVKSRRVVSEIAYSKPIITEDGQDIKLSAKLRGDIYNVEADTTSGIDGTHVRVLPELSMTWAKPYVSKSGYHTITPKLMTVISPRGGNPSKIPNEDSVAYELDTSNLFDTNRFCWPRPS